MSPALAHHGERGAASRTWAAPRGRPGWRWGCGRSRTSSSSSPASRSATAWCDATGRCTPSFAGPSCPQSPDPVAASAAALRHRGRRAPLRAPARRRARRGSPTSSRSSGRPSAPRRTQPELLARTLQVQGIWFQLLSIAEQNAAMRRRRQTESERGARAGPGHVRPGDRRRRLAARSPPTRSTSCSDAPRSARCITAHPTEAKRVTVLEKHRRIYRRLVDLESPRWTPRERQALIDGAPQRDRAAVAHRRAAPREAHRAAGGLLGTPLLQRDAVRGGPRPAREARARAAHEPTRASASRSRRSSSSAPGSAATATGIRSSPTMSPG